MARWADLITGVSLAAMGFPGLALAQSPDASGPSSSIAQLDDIVVVAQKRAENLQKVPIAITAVGSEALEARGIESVIDLGDKVPGLMIRKFNGLILPVLRGVGNPSSTAGNESSVAVYADGVYFPRLPSGFLDLNNVERVEVLKGPQGTLFGRNSTGGVINIITRDPSQEAKFEGSVSYGRFDALTGKLYATTGLSDKVAIDLSVAGRTDDGFGKNIATGRRYGYNDNFITRSKLVADLETIKISLSGYYSWVKASGNKLGYPGTKTASSSGIYASTPVNDPPGSPPYTIIGRNNAASEIDQQNTFKTWGGALRIAQELGFADLVSISAYNHVDETSDFDGDYTPANDLYVPLKAPVRSFSQELQLAGPADGPFKWIVGGYYFWNKSTYKDTYFVISGVQLLSAPAKQVARSIAGFAQASYEIVPNFTLTGGIRYTEDRTRGEGGVYLYDHDGASSTPPLNVPFFVPPPGSKKINKVSFKLAADYQVTPDALVYASFSRGFKSGAFNILTYNSSSPTKPEELDAYEIGFKGMLADRRIRINGAAFYYDIKSPQVQLISNSTVFYSNAGSSRVKGAELEINARASSAVTLRASATYLDSKYKRYVDAPISQPNLLTGGADPFDDDNDPNTPGVTQFNARGYRTPLAAKFVYNIGADLNFSTPLGEGMLTVDYSHNSGYFFEPDNFLHQKAYGLLDAQLRLDLSDTFAVRLFGRNLTDAKYANGASTQVGPAGYVWSPGTPLTYGVGVDFSF